MSANPPATGQMVTVPRAAVNGVTKVGASGTEVALTNETSTAASAAMARAGIEARFVMAMQRPRDDMEVRQRLLKACQRSTFAEVAIYKKPIGKGVEGPSIRMAEEAARCMRNIDTSVDTIYEDREKRIVRVSVTDLEANLTYPQAVVIGKTVERSKVAQGQKVYNARLNSRQESVYEVEATEDEMLMKTNNIVSKTLRTLLLRLIPGDILEEAIAECYRTRKAQFGKDPQAEIKRMCDSFDELKITAKHLAEYLGHPVTDSTAEEVAKMRTIYTTIRDREMTWAQIMDERLAELGGETKPPADANGDAPASAQGAAPKPTAGPPKNLAEATAKGRSAREATPARKVSVVGADGKPIDTSDAPPPIDDSLISGPGPGPKGEKEPPEPGSDG